MIDALLWIGALVVSLAVLIKSADFFTDSSERIGIALGVPSFIIGVTIVSIGTSLPELVSAIVAVVQGSSEIVSGTVVGSNISNIFLVLGAAALLSKKKIKIGHDLINVDLPMLVGSALLLSVMIWDGDFTLAEGVICLIAGSIYVYYITSSEDSSMSHEMPRKNGERLGWKNPLVLVVSAFFIYIGAKYTVESVIELSQIFSVGSEVIALSVVAFGTSLPELTVSVTAARKGNAAIAVGNVLGSNIFNSFAVMGIPALIGTLTVPASLLSFSLPMMIIASILFFFVTQDREITRWEGAMLVIFYVFFIGRLYGLV